MTAIMITVTVANPTICRRSRGVPRRQRTISDARRSARRGRLRSTRSTTRLDRRWSGSCTRTSASRPRPVRPDAEQDLPEPSGQRSVGVELRQYGQRQPHEEACRDAVRDEQGFLEEGPCFSVLSHQSPANSRQARPAVRRSTRRRRASAPCDIRVVRRRRLRRRWPRAGAPAPASSRSPQSRIGVAEQYPADNGRGHGHPGEPETHASAGDRDLATTSGWARQGESASGTPTRSSLDAVMASRSDSSFPGVTGWAPGPDGNRKSLTLR